MYESDCFASCNQRLMNLSRRDPDLSPMSLHCLRPLKVFAVDNAEVMRDRVTLLKCGLKGRPEAVRWNR